MEKIKNESHQKLMAAVGEWYANQLLNPNPDDNTPVGPWSPYIRNALYDVQNSAGAFYSGIRSAEISNFRKDSFVYLNPQPIPPRQLFIHSLTSQILDKSASFMDMGKMQDNGEERAIIIVGGLVSDYVDELCLTPPKIILIYHNVPDPVPHPNYTIELLTAALQFQQAAKYSRSDAIKKVFNKAADKLINTGLKRM
ncbi:MAG: hypothetical protein ABI266_01260 [Ginsengibacter sp.]